MLTTAKTGLPLLQEAGVIDESSTRVVFNAAANGSVFGIATNVLIMSLVDAGIIENNVVKFGVDMSMDSLVTVTTTKWMNSERLDKFVAALIEHKDAAKQFLMEGK